ncbi:unnamed protein product [Allacma fusca]|uniref:Ubiquitin-like protease family profile domain-containing protein n=1 Tax=Allacma fusca TaxID=39272 RepID=A0A8J2JWV7_9HEXA|nr:unnamed protein product [Allacma fusca]
MERNSLILSYGDYVIRKNEMDILGSTQWLNDTIIGFYFEYLSRLYPESGGFKFFGPEITQCIKLGSKHDIPVFTGGLECLRKINFMFWPVNDSMDPHDHYGGSHWSLLVFSRRENFFGHFDSTMTAGGGNDIQARRIYEKLAPFVSHSATYQNLLCETQRNGYDCGIHVLCNAEKIADAASKYGRIQGVQTATSDFVAGMRNHLIRLIEKESLRACR